MVTREGKQLLKQALVASVSKATLKQMERNVEAPDSDRAVQNARMKKLVIDHAWANKALDQSVITDYFTWLTSRLEKLLCTGTFTEGTVLSIKDLLSDGQRHARAVEPFTSYPFSLEQWQNRLTMIEAAKGSKKEEELGSAVKRDVEILSDMLHKYHKHLAHVQDYIHSATLASGVELQFARKQYFCDEQEVEQRPSTQREWKQSLDQFRTEQCTLQTIHSRLTSLEQLHNSMHQLHQQITKEIPLLRNMQSTAQKIEVFQVPAS